MPIMPPLMRPDTPAWTTIDQTEYAPLAQPSLDWSKPEDRRVMRRDHKRTRADEKKMVRRVAIAANQRAFSGRVYLCPAISELLSDAKHVVTTHHKDAFRATFTGTLTCGDHTYRGHFVVLQDSRVAPGWACAEIIWTGKDWRVHIWRASPANEQTPVALEITA